MNDDPSHDDGARTAVLRDGTSVCIRPIHPLDAELERRFIEAMSPESRRFRFLGSMRTPSASLLRQLTVIDPATDVAYVALLGAGDLTTQIGAARFSTRPDGADCEFAVTIGDAWQHHGLGTLLMQRLIEVAVARGIGTMQSTEAATNAAMRHFADHWHFLRRRDPDDPALAIYSVDLAAYAPVSDAV